MSGKVLWGYPHCNTVANLGVAPYLVLPPCLLYQTELQRKSMPALLQAHADLHVFRHRAYCSGERFVFERRRRVCVSRKDDKNSRAPASCQVCKSVCFSIRNPPLLTLRSGRQR